MATYTAQPNDCVSCGSLRTSDLIDNFAAALNMVTYNKASPQVERLISESRTWLHSTARHDDRASVRQESAEYGESLVSDLSDALNEFAPAGHAFGAHGGDGACFGFWQVD